MELSILVFKPDALHRRVKCDGRTQTIAQVGRRMLLETGLEIQKEATIQLEADEVFRMYERVLSPNPEDDAVWGTAWKEEVVEHLTSRPIEALLLVDPLLGTPIEKAQQVKQELRVCYAAPGDVVRNLVHVPDDHELDMTRNLLFRERRYG